MKDVYRTYLRRFLGNDFKVTGNISVVNRISKNRLLVMISDIKCDGFFIDHVWTKIRIDSLPKDLKLRSRVEFIGTVGKYAHKGVSSAKVGLPLYTTAYKLINIRKIKVIS